MWVGTALSLEATCGKITRLKAGAGEFLCQRLSTSARLAYGNSTRFGDEQNSAALSSKMSLQGIPD